MNHQINLNYAMSLNEITYKDLPRVGGKATSLGEMTSCGLPVPSGFCLTVDCFLLLIESYNIRQLIEILRSHLPDDSGLIKHSENIREKIRGLEIPKVIEEQIISIHKALKRGSAEDIFLVVRSSATVEDLSKASFAGQFDSYLAVRGATNLISKIKDCWASLFNERSLIYASKKGIPVDRLLMGVIVQRMIRAEKAGIMFTMHPVTEDEGLIILEANWGLGESIVSGVVTPDRYVVNKESLKVQESHVSEKDHMSIFDEKKGTTSTVETPTSSQAMPCLKEEEIVSLANLGKSIEKIFNLPQDIEWAIEGGNIYILQSRPVTTRDYGEPKIETD